MFRPERFPLVLALALAAATTGMDCGGPRPFECEPPARLTTLSDVHFADQDCDGARKLSEGRPTAAYLRKACEQLAPGEGVPERVRGARVRACEPGAESGRYAGGVLLDLEVCCP